MSFHRRRNVFSLGDYQGHQIPQDHVRSLASRRPSPRASDPFERDPFKIQSYNFRYADRPDFPLHNLSNRLASGSSGQPTKSSTAAPSKQFETFYYNHDFATSNNGKENFASTNKFHEHRRRKFLHDQPLQSGGGRSAGPRNTATGQSIYQRISGSTGSRSSAATSLASRCPTGSTFSGVVTPTTSPLLRSGSAREFMQACRSSSHSLVANVPAPKSSSDIANNLDTPFNSPSKSYSRSSLLVNAKADRCYTDKPRNDGRRGSCSATALCPLGGRDGSHVRASASYYNRRTSPAAKSSRENINRDNDDACSGCHINININSMDNNPENVTVNIETSDQAGSSQSQPVKTSYKPSNLSTIKVNGKDINVLSNRSKIPGVSSTPLTKSSRLSSNSYTALQPKISSKTFIIESRSSNTSMRAQRSVSNETLGRPHARASSPITPKITNVPSKERLPSMVPWCLDTKPKSYNNYNERIGTSRGSPRNPINDTSRQRFGYSSALNDIRNVKRQHQTEKRTTSTIATKLKADRALVNPTMSPFEQRLHSIAPINNNPLKRHHSHLSMTISTNTSKPSGSQVTSRSHTLKRSPTYHSYTTPMKPVNVNINVYSDKLKMLRV